MEIDEVGIIPEDEIGMETEGMVIPYLSLFILIPSPPISFLSGNFRHKIIKNVS
jgi:hypothetical protein